MNSIKDTSRGFFSTLINSIKMSFGYQINEYDYSKMV